MRKTTILLLLFFSSLLLLSSAIKPKENTPYVSFYKSRLSLFKKNQYDLLDYVKQLDEISDSAEAIIRLHIRQNRGLLKKIDFWLRYFEPIAYKKINGPLPVEWETEVFEKFEAPYKREGAGLTLAELYLDETERKKEMITELLAHSIQATDVFLADSITRNLNSPHHFFLANRLYLLNIAAIYTTGFECPDTSNIIPELVQMLEDTRDLYGAFNQSFPDKAIKQEFLTLYEKAMEFVAKQPFQYSLFDHFSFIQKYVNPLYRLNQQMIKEYRIRSYSFNDYSLNNNATSIFDKSLFTGQNSKGVFIGISDADALAELRETGRLLFYDPILSVNNKRSCASCHKPDMFFADTGRATHPTLDGLTSLKRNTPSLVNAIFNHLIMLDGKHINLEAQCRAVITNPDEMGGNEDEIVKKVMSCDEYKTVFKKYLKATPHYKSVNLEHIASAIILYYSDFSSYYSSFDRAMNEMKPVDGNVQKGFNLFMSKAQCATCHFVPVFNGTKPPYTGSEFEVIGVPADTAFASLSPDKGRHLVNPASETLNAFRTGTVRNATFTKPYMHNGVFNTLDEVINFYAAGGGAGRGLRVSNQTLSSDSLQLSEGEKKDLIAFIQSLTEEIPLQKPPAHLPQSRIKLLNARVVGGEY